MADDDFDESLLLALDQFERQHAVVPEPQHQSFPAHKTVVPANHQQQQQQPPSGSRPPLQVNNQQQQPPQQQQQQRLNNQPQQHQPYVHGANQHQQYASNSNTAHLDQLWGLFCSGPAPTPCTSACTGWANRRLQQWSSSKANRGPTGHQQQQRQQQQRQQVQHQQGQHHGQQLQQQQQVQQHSLQHVQQNGSSISRRQEWQRPQQLQQQLQQQSMGMQNPCMPPLQQVQPQQQQQAAGSTQGNWPQHNPQQQQHHTQWPPPLPQQQQQQQQQQQWHNLQQQQQQWPPYSTGAHPPLQQQQQQQGMAPAPQGVSAAAAAAVPAAHHPNSSSSGQGLNASGSGGVPANWDTPTAAAAVGASGLSVPPAHATAAPAAAAASGAGGVSGGPLSAAAGGAAPGAAAGAAVSGGTAASPTGLPAAAAAAGGAGVSGGPAGAASGGCEAAAGGAAGAAAGSGGPLCLYDAKLALGRDRLVEVVFSGWHTQIAAVCSSVPGCRRADGNTWGKTWLLPADQVNALQQALNENLPSNVRVRKFEPLPDLVRNLLAAADKRPDDSTLVEALSDLELAPGVSLWARMRPFQREGVKFGLRAGGRLLLGDEMGLGKTVQACALAQCYRNEWPVLVVTPSSLRLSWAAALYQWLRVTEDRVLVTLKVNDMRPLSNARSEQEARNMYDFVIVSYDMLKDVSEVLGAVGFKVVILDESHCIKNPTAQRTKFAKPLVEKAARAILLSGTPALSNPSELLSQLQALLPKARLTKTAFEERYMDVRQYGNFRKAVGSKNGEELNRLLTSTVMIRRKKAEVLKDLPAKNRNQVPLLLDPSKRAELDKLKGKLNEVRQLSSNMHGVGEAVGGGLLAGMEQAQRHMVMQLWHETAKVKAKAVADYVKELLLNSDPDDKCLVFAYHRELMDAIEKGVNEVRAKNKEMKGLAYMRIDGSTPAKQREDNVNAFQNDQACRVAILNIKAAGVGLTLTRASTVVFAELAWTPSEVQQAEDRAHRIGQTQSVNVHLLLVRDSIDDLMWELLQNKLATTGTVLDGQAARMEVQKSSTQQAKGRGGSSGGPRAPAAAAAVPPPQQPSITNFFTANAAGGGEPASKKPRTG